MKTNFWTTSSISVKPVNYLLATSKYIIQKLNWGTNSRPATNDLMSPTVCNLRSIKAILQQSCTTTNMISLRSLCSLSVMWFFEADLIASGIFSKSRSIISFYVSSKRVSSTLPYLPEQITNINHVWCSTNCNWCQWAGRESIRL